MELIENTSCFGGKNAVYKHLSDACNCEMTFGIYLPPQGLCCTNALRDSLFESSVVAGAYEQLVPDEVQDQEPAFVQHGVKAARFTVDLV